MAEAARDLLTIYRAMNATTPEVVFANSPDMNKTDLLASAYGAVALAVKLSRELRDQPDRYGLSATSAMVVSVLLRRAACDLEREADEWDRTSRLPTGG